MADIGEITKRIVAPDYAPPKRPMVPIIVPERETVAVPVRKETVNA